MRVFVYKPDTKHLDPVQIALNRDVLTTQEARRYAELMCFHTGERHEASWSSPPMIIRYDKYDDAQFLEACDFPIPYDSGGLVMSDHAKSRLESTLGPFGEFLPLDCNEGKYWILNVTHVVDALDHDASEWLPVPGQAPTLWAPAFRPHKLEGEVIFRLPLSYRKSQQYFTQRLRDEIDRHSLTGFAARVVWSNE